MGAFLEERLSVAVKYGASYGDDYAVEITRTKDGSEYRRLLHPFPIRDFQFAYDIKATALYAQVANLYHRAFKNYAGFRVRCLDDYSTNGETSTPTALDQTLGVISAGVTYQLLKVYGAGGTPLSIGRPYRNIFKPVAGTVLIAVAGVPVTTGWTVNTTTGIVTFSSPPAGQVTGGCEFDIPARFDSVLNIRQNLIEYRDIADLTLIEILNP